MLQLSLLQIPFAAVRFSGFCVVADSELEAFQTIIELSKRHFEMIGTKEPVRVSILNDDPQFCRVSIQFDSQIGTVNFENVDRNMAEKFIDDFNDSGQFFLLAGYRNNEVKIIHPNLFYIVSENLYQDQKQVSGRKFHINLRSILFDFF